MRYAIYLAPPASSPLWQRGSRWLGRDAHTGQALPQPRYRGLAPDRLFDLTRTARHYGFHATLIPPFRLAEGVDEARLHAALTDFALRQQPFLLPPLELSLLDGCFCLRPVRHCPSLHTLAALCIRATDCFRAPLTPSEMARRRAAQLSGQEKKNLEIWGYPYVFEQFRCHFTLTARLVAGREQEGLHAVLTDFFAPLPIEAPRVDSLCLFVESAEDEPMRCVHRFAFAPIPPEPEDASGHDQHPSSQDLCARHQRHPA